MTLKEARERCHEARKKLAARIDPGAERKAAKAEVKAQETDSFEAVAREWFEKFSRSWVFDHAAIVMRRLEANVFPWLGSHPIVKITAPEVLAVLRRIEARAALGRCIWPTCCGNRSMPDWRAMRT